MVPKTWNVGYVSALTWPVIGRSRLRHQRHGVNCDKNSFLKEYVGQSWEEGGRLPLYGRQDLFPNHMIDNRCVSVGSRQRLALVKEFNLLFQNLRK